MKKNISKPDKVIRFIIGAVALLLSFTNFLEDSFISSVLLCLGAILIISVAVSFCPLYAFLGINTNKTKDKFKMY